MKTQTKKIEKLIAAIDFSEYSRSVLEYAVEVAAAANAQILVINIINQKEIDSVEKAVNSKHPDAFVLAKHLADEAGRRELKLKALIKEIAGSTKLPVNTLVGHGAPAVEILEAIDREKADFMVFGPKGRTDLKGFLFGSVAEKLFRHSPVPVLSLRSRSAVSDNIHQTLMKNRNQDHVITH